MANELPTLDSTNKELKSIYRVHSKRFFHWLGTNGISANSSRDITLLAHNEIVKRSNNRFILFSQILTTAVFVYSIITVVFAFFDYSGDKDWQKRQLKELEQINESLNKNNSEIKSLKLEILEAKQRIDSPEKPKVKN